MSLYRVHFTKPADTHTCWGAAFSVWHADKGSACACSYARRSCGSVRLWMVHFPQPHTPEWQTSRLGPPTRIGILTAHVSLLTWPGVLPSVWLRTVPGNPFIPYYPISCKLHFLQWKYEPLAPGSRPSEVGPSEDTLRVSLPRLYVAFLL